MFLFFIFWFFVAQVWVATAIRRLAAKTMRHDDAFLIRLAAGLLYLDAFCGVLFAAKLALSR